MEMLNSENAMLSQCRFCRFSGGVYWSGERKNRLWLIADAISFAEGVTFPFCRLWIVMDD